MPIISLTIQPGDITAIKKVFGGDTNAETLALVKAFLGRKLEEEVHDTQVSAAKAAVEETVTRIVVI